MASKKQLAWRKKFARMSKAGKFKKSKKSKKSKSKKNNGLSKLEKFKIEKRLDELEEIMIKAESEGDTVKDDLAGHEHARLTAKLRGEKNPFEP